MADLTVLSPLPVPLYPSLPGASRSSLFKTFIPGASSSRFSLTSLATDLPFTSPRTTITTRAEGSEDDEEISEDGSDFSSYSSSGDSCEDSLPREGSMVADESESPVTVNDGTWNTFYNDKEPQTARPYSTSNKSSFPQNDLSKTSLSSLSRGRSSYQRHRPTRSQSAPPFKTTFSQEEDGEATPRTAYTPNASQIGLEQYHIRSPRRSRTDYSSSSSELSLPPLSVPSASWAVGCGQTRGGQLLKPPPPLHRPTTFWRRTPRSGLTSSSYSPSSHLIRRSTFVAAGLPFDKPMADLSALGVESRVRSTFAEERAAKVQDVFWEVVLPR